MRYRTFDEWSKAGYRIKKGSKAIWMDNIPMFSDKQVEKRSYMKPVLHSSYYDKKEIAEEAPKIIYFADGSGYMDCGGPCGPLYFDRNGDT